MADDIYRIRSISQLHRELGLDPPLHPLITLIDVKHLHSKHAQKMAGQRFATDFYSVSLKDGSCGMLYGRNHYDFEEGVLSLFAPKQVFTSTGEPGTFANGWMLQFHPDLIRGTSLDAQMDQYSFFSYDVHEALHLSKREQDLLLDLAEKIKDEYSQNIDRHTQGLLVSHLELLLNYCVRFYERQFHTRKKQNVDVVTKVEQLLHDYYQAGKQLDQGTPSIQYLADGVHLSANYLSDLLKKETGRNAKDHVNAFVVDKAKSRLLGSKDAVSEIAFSLGFNYPHYFSRLFKRKTGLTPQQYREQNILN